MPTRVRRRRGRLTLSEYTREFILGLFILAMSATIMLLGSAAASQLQPYANFNVTIGSTTVNMNFGFIYTIIVAFGSILLFLYGFRKLIRARI